MSRTRIKRKAPKAKSERLDVRLDELTAILDRAQVGPLSSEDVATLREAVDTLAFLTQELEAKGTTIARLRRLLFGPGTEKTKRIFPDETPGAGNRDPAGRETTTGEADGANSEPSSDPVAPPRAPGHGRNGIEAYVGAEKIAVPHTALHPGDRCPLCGRGKLYRLPEPARLLRIRAMAPLCATCYEQERLRCNACGEVFTAEPPAGVGSEKYDETAAAMIGLLRYGSGLPFNRIARLERGFGIPLPPPTQWEVVARAAAKIRPAHEELIRQAAQAKVVHNDDTRMKILQLAAGARRDADEADDDDEPGRKPGERTGVFTSGILAVDGDRQIALFFTGQQHAGENLADVLRHRAAQRPPPIQMCDALAANTAGELRTIVANCLAHARRGFADVAASFPDECRHVLEELGKVYHNDAVTRQEKMPDDERLRFHQEHSRPVMEGLRAWMEAQLAEKKVEPNSGLGDAMHYMLKHWEKLTLFLRVPGAPLDNSAVERSLKKAICHRKNSLFYKTLNGAQVGDLFMSLIYTAELAKANPFDYLVVLQRYHDLVAESPADWMPWNYRDTLAGFAADADPAT